MKCTNVFGILYVLFGVLSVFAQDQFELGILAGPNFSDAKIEDNEGRPSEVTGKTKFGGGIQLEKALSDNFTLGINILYNRNGVEVRNDDNIIFDVWADYIEVPLYLKISTGKEIRPHLILGPSIGFLLSSEVDVALGGLPFNGDFSTVLEKTNFSLVVGAGVDLPVWKGHAFIQGRYVYGIRDVLKGGTFELKAGETIRTEATVDPEDNLFTRGFQIMAGYSFPI